MPSAQPLSVLHYTGSAADRGGILAHLHALAAAHEFECVLGVNPGFRPRRSPAPPLLEMPPADAECLSLLTLLRSFAVARAARGWLQAAPRRVFHGHSRMGLLVALRLRAQGERAVFASVHCYGRRRWFYRHAAQKLGGNLYWLTPAMKRYYAVGDGWEQCIPSCTHLMTDARGQIPADFRPRPSVLRLGGIGALVEWKGWHLVLEAIAALPPNQRTGVSFAHIGSAENSDASRRYERRLREIARSRGLESVVTWRGEEASSAALLQETDCLVVPSVCEPLSLAMLEALALNIPVVATDCGGPSDVLVAGEDGWFFKSGDSGSLSRVLGELVGSGAWQRAQFSPERLRRFTAPVVAAEWRAVYERALT